MMKTGNGRKATAAILAAGFMLTGSLAAIEGVQAARISDANAAPGSECERNRCGSGPRKRRTGV